MAISVNLYVQIISSLCGIYIFYFFTTIGLVSLVPEDAYHPVALISMNKYSSKSILAQASPSIKRSGPVTHKDTGVTCNLGVPRIILRDVIKLNYVQSDDHQFFNKDSDNFNLLKPCSRKLEDIFNCSNSTAKS